MTTLNLKRPASTTVQSKFNVEVDALIDRWNRPRHLASHTNSKPPAHQSGNQIRTHVLRDD